MSYRGTGAPAGTGTATGHVDGRARRAAGGDPPSAYADLGRWLTRTIATGKTRLRAVAAAGRETAATSLPRAAPFQRRGMHAALVSLGFSPSARSIPPERSRTLCNCPYRDVVRESQQIVCTLHRGMTRGLVDAIAPQTRLAGFVPRGPDAAGCLIELRGELADEAVAHAAAAEEPDKRS